MFGRTDRSHRKPSRAPPVTSSCATATPPFRVLSTASGVAAHLAGLSECAWSPDGRQIAISANPILVGTAGAVSVALYDVAHKTLRVVASPSQDIAIASIFFSSDSKSLWIGGPHNGANGVYRVTDLDGTPQLTAEFPGATGISADADGQRLVVSYQTSVQVFDGNTLQPVTQIIPLGSSYITAVNSAPDGHAAVVGSSQGWRLVDLDAQQLIGPWTPAPSDLSHSSAWTNTPCTPKPPTVTARSGTSPPQTSKPPHAPSPAEPHNTGMAEIPPLGRTPPSDLPAIPTP